MKRKAHQIAFPVTLTFVMVAFLWWRFYLLFFSSMQMFLLQLQAKRNRRQFLEPLLRSYRGPIKQSRRVQAPRVPGRIMEEPYLGDARSERHRPLAKDRAENITTMKAVSICRSPFRSAEEVHPAFRGGRQITSIRKETMKDLRIIRVVYCDRLHGNDWVKYFSGRERVKGWMLLA